jgi:hypothetical protein
MTPKYEINPSAIATHVPILIRQVLLVVGGVIAAVGFLSRRDMAGLWAYLQTDDFMTVAATAATLGTLAYGQWRLVTIADSAPDEVAVVTAPTPPPAIEPQP